MTGEGRATPRQHGLHAFRLPGRACTGDGQETYFPIPRRLRHDRDQRPGAGVLNIPGADDVASFSLAEEFSQSARLMDRR